MWLTIGTERFWQIYAGPHLYSLDRIFRFDYHIGTQYVTYERELIPLYNGTINLLISLLIPELQPRKDNIPNFCC